MDAAAVIVLIANLLLGIVFCFFGNRWLKAVLALFGFAAGFLLGSTLLPVFTSFGSTAVLLGSLFLGVVFALLFVFALFLGIFAIGFGGGLLLCLLAAEFFALNLLEWYVFIPMLVVCCGLGALTLNNRRIFISIFTSYIGATALALFVYQLVSGTGLDTMPLYSEQAALSIYRSEIFLIALGVLFFAGLIIQLTVTSKNKR